MENTPESLQVREADRSKPSFLTTLAMKFHSLLHPFSTPINPPATEELWRIVDTQGNTQRTERRSSPSDGSPGYTDIIPFPKRDTALDEEVWDRR